MIFFKEKLTLFFLVLSFTMQGWGQFLVNQGNTITITEEAKFTVVGGILNDGRISNDGQISITENWENSAQYLANSGFLILNGIDQSLDHNNQGFFGLVITGGGEKHLLSNLNIVAGGNINFEAGLVFPSTTASLTLAQDVTVEGGNEEAYVVGQVFHQGNGFKFFPIGKNGRYRPLTLLNVTGEDPHLGVEVFEGNWRPMRNYDLDEISTTRYWQITHVTPETAFHGSTVSLSVGDDEPFDQIDVLVPSQADSLGGEFRGMGQANVSGDIGSGTVTSEQLVTKPIIAIAKSSTITLNKLLYVPNAFSPQSYNQEERGIKVYGQEVSEEGFEFKIFDRWGKVYYQSTSFAEANERGWRIAETASLKGLKSFKYTLKGKFNNGVPFSRLGSIRLIQ